MSTDDPQSEGRPPDDEASTSPDQPQPGQQDNWYTLESPFLDEEGPTERPLPVPPPLSPTSPTGDVQPEAPPSEPTPTSPPALDPTVRMRRTPAQPAAGAPPPPDRPSSGQESGVSRPARPVQPRLFGERPPQRPSSGPARPVPERTGYVAPQRRPAPPAQPGRPAARSAPRRRKRTFQGCLVRGFVASALALVVLIFAGIAAAAIGYVYIGQQLPPADELWGRQTAWVSSHIYDRDGTLLWELLDPQGGRRTRVTLDQVSQFLIDATVATEDETFWQHRGFSLDRSKCPALKLAARTWLVRSQCVRHYFT